uniref:Putative lipoprotein n=1 Tax=mine drainage metagenome TaxID=410659 RepID=E6QND2_9ZZZZ
MVAAEMMKDALGREWISDFSTVNNRKRTVIVGEVRNLSDEHISVSAFIEELQRNFINSGRVVFVASSTERIDIRGERADQDINASEATRKAMGKEKGADFMLKGTINTIIDVNGSDQLRYYQVNLTLISLVDNVIVWNGEKKIKKMVARSKLRF